MSHSNHYAHGVRIANFSTIDLPADDLLNFGSEASASIVKQIRRYADLPYVYVVGNEQAKQVDEVLSALKAIRSPCYPYAIFAVEDANLVIEGPDLDVIKINTTDPDSLHSRITEYAAGRFHIDDSQLRSASSGPPPATADVAIVGAGVTGLYAANRLRESGISFCILDKRDKVGGIWSMYANATSRVNTSEGAYRLIENTTRSNRDHSATREILDDVAQLSKNVSNDLYLGTEVLGIEKTANGYQIRYNREGDIAVIKSKGVILAINDRVGTPRELEWPDQSRFQGAIISGISDKTKELDWRDKKVVVVGMGAFAVENARTALEGGARHVTVICRRHGTICPKIIDYLNFATPYDDDFKHDKKSNIRNMMYWKKLYQLSGATQPECWMGKIKHAGHTISVSDIWFIAHFLKKIDTITGEVNDLYPNGVVVNGQQRIDADIIVNCIGFERNTSAAKAICGHPEIYNTNYVDKDFMYLADAYIDDDAFNSFFGSSVIEMVKFYMKVYVNYFDNPEYEKMADIDGIEKIPIEDRKWSHYIKGAAALIQNDRELNESARSQVAQRTKNFLESHDLETYIAENKREWIDTHSMLAGKPMREEDCLPFVFDKLL
ncbi:MAG: FAD-dependent oxidoreductase [Deltaproteobacteria bacterium]|nr:FAD-dependent oxidoreductase [Deltaproteobacteria bacterium]